jgi:hypothetical protein
MEQKAYQMELGMNGTRHIMSAIANSVVDKKKRPQGYSPKDIIDLPLIDGRANSAEERQSEQEAAEGALKRRKEIDNRQTKDG